MAEKILYTMDYESLKDLFINSGLEIHWEDPAPEGLLTCFKMIDEETGERFGAAGIVLNEKNEYILRCVAVEEKHRGKGYGIQLVKKEGCVAQHASGSLEKCLNSIRNLDLLWQKEAMHHSKQNAANAHSITMDVSQK